MTALMRHTLALCWIVEVSTYGGLTVHTPTPSLHQAAVPASGPHCPTFRPRSRPLRPPHMTAIESRDAHTSYSRTHKIGVLRRMVLSTAIAARLLCPPGRAEAMQSGLGHIRQDSVGAEHCISSSATQTATATQTAGKLSLPMRQEGAGSQPVAQVAQAPVVVADGVVSRVITAVSSTVKEAYNHLKPAERDAIVLLLSTALVVPVMEKLKVSPILGFLFAGLVLGPRGLHWVTDVATAEALAELGVVFFLFEMGLELSTSRLLALSKDAFGLGTFQFGITGAVLSALAVWLLPVTAPTAIVIGGGLALSSSAFVMRLLSDKGQLASRFGRASFGILLFQDLAVVPLLVVTPLLASGGQGLVTSLVTAAVKATAALGLIAVLGRVILNNIFRVVADSKSEDAFIATILFTVLSMSAFTKALGLSDTLGAFLAGVLLAESKYRYQIEADLSPFRGLLLGLFFITIGFSIDLGLAMSQAGPLLAMFTTLIVLKTAITFLICKASGMSSSNSIRTGLMLSQGGEFAFVVFGIASGHGLLDPALCKLLLTAVVLSMCATPALTDLGAFIANKLMSRQGQIEEVDNSDSQSDFVLVCGYGRVGQVVGNLLTEQLVRFKAFDMEPARVIEAKQSGLPVFFGDARRPDVLRAYGCELDNAKAVVVTFDGEKDCMSLVRTLRREYPDLPIFARAKDEGQRRKLLKQGVTAIVTGPQESSLLLGGAVLRGCGVGMGEVTSLIEETRLKFYKAKFEQYGPLVESIPRLASGLGVVKAVAGSIAGVGKPSGLSSLDRVEANLLEEAEKEEAEKEEAEKEEAEKEEAEKEEADPEIEGDTTA